MRNATFILLILFSSCSGKGHHNIPDIEDKNRIQAEEEERLNDPWNWPDEYDGNSVPDQFEKRKKIEEREYFGDPPVFD